MAERNYEYEKQKAESEIQAYHRGLLRYTVACVESLNDYQVENKREDQNRFKKNLNGLVKMYWRKFDLVDDLDLPVELEDEDQYGPKNVNGLDMNKCEKIFYKIQELQEELGHTKLESLKRGNRVI